MKALCKDGNCVMDDFGQSLMVIRKEKYDEKLEKFKEIQQLWMFSQKELMATKETNEDLKVNIKNLEKTLETNVATMGKMNASVEAYENGNGILQKNLRNVESQVSSLEKDLLEKVNELAKTAALHDQSMEDLTENHQLKVADLNVKFTDMERGKNDIINELKDTLEKTEASLKCSEQKSEQLESLVQSKDENIERQEQFISDLKKSLGLLKIDIGKKEKILDQLESNLQNSIRKYDEFVSQHHSETKELKEQIKLKERQIKLQKAELYEMTTRMKKFEGKPKWK